MSPSASLEDGATAVAGLSGAPSRRARIIELNDQLRTTFKGGRAIVIPGVYQLDARLCGRALSVMARRCTFAAADEHDWGVFVFAGYVFEWRIEYRDQDGIGVSADPADPEKTLRVLTLYTVGDVLAQLTLPA